MSADSIRVMRPLFQAGEGGSIPTSALCLTLDRVDFETAKGLNRLWHSRLPRFGTGFVANQPFLCYAAEFDGLAYAVAIWSNPVARNLPQREWLELRRLAAAPDAPRNTCSRMLAVMTRLIRRERPDVVRLVSYHDTVVHTGGIYRAAGWTSTSVSGNGNWTRRKRPRPAAQSEAPKQRWEKVIR
jgi:hypothetical protein